MWICSVICPSVSCCSFRVFHLCCCYSPGIPCLTVHVSLSYNKTGRASVLYNFILVFLRVYIYIGAYFIWLSSYVTCRSNSNAPVGRLLSCHGLWDKRANYKWQKILIKQNNILWLCFVSCLCALWPADIIRNPTIRIVHCLQRDILLRNCQFSHVAPHIQSRTF